MKRASVDASHHELSGAYSISNIRPISAELSTMKETYLSIFFSQKVARNGVLGAGEIGIIPT